MLRLNKKQKGFTLIELLVVVIIVAILAAVGAPLLTGNIERARVSEADADFGTIRTGLRSYLVEHSSLPTAIELSDANVKTGDLLGRYFDNTDFGVTRLSGTTYCINVTGGSGGSGAPKKADVTGVSRSMRENGDIFKDVTNCSGTAIN